MAAPVGVDLNLDAGGSGRVDFDPFDVSSRMDVTGGGNADAVDLDLSNALRDPDATGEGLALPNNPASGQTTREMTVKMTPAGSEAPTVEQPRCVRSMSRRFARRWKAPCAAS